MKKKCQILLLPIQKANQELITSDRINLIYKNNEIFNPFKNQFFELYILSDDKFDDRDWVCYRNKEILKPRPDDSDRNYVRKIIATTDKSLEICKNIKSEYCNNSQIIGCNIPQPSRLFVVKFIEEWNKGNKITKVMVEYEEETAEFVGQFNRDAKQIRLKVDKNNEITITKVKDNYSIEEIINDIEQAMIQGLTLAQYRDKWILQ